MAGPGSGTDQNANNTAPQQEQNAGQNANNNTNNETEEQRTRTRRRELSNYQQSALMQNRIAAVQRHIEARQNAPQNPQQAPAPKKKNSAWGNFKHGLFTALSAIADFTVGGLFWLVSTPFMPTKNYYKAAQKVETQADTDIIPGTKNERFQDPDVDGGPDNQPVIDDVRRLPLVYEREIFDDPNQEPTITLHFKQAKEGSSFALSNKLQAGHAFLTLKYTKPDPLTGENKRYQTTVGFGAQADPLTGGTQLLNGMFVPGILNDDFGSAADVSKEYTISNKALNKVILAAQKFAPGGYQLMKRNCTTFVAEMAKAAGLGEEVKDFLKEVDFETEANPVLPLVVPGVLIGGPTATSLGQYAAYKDVGKINYAYGQFGQYLYNKDDILRIEKIELNARMYGYDPSYSGEALRNMEGTGLNSTAYGNNIVNGKLPKDKALEADKNKALQFRFQTMLDSLNNAKRSLQTALDKNFPNNDTNTEVMRFLEETTTQFRDTINALYEPEMLKNLSQRRELYISFWKNISDRMKTLNDYYLNNYQGNKKVNIRFQHVSSLCANTKTLILECEKLQKLQLMDVQLTTHPNDFKGYIDPSRDSADSLKKLFFNTTNFEMPHELWVARGQNHEFTDIKIPTAELTAGLRVYGNMKDCYRYHLLRLTPKRTKAEAKEYARLLKKRESMREFVKAQESYAGKRPFTLHDYKYAFVDLPKAEKDSGLPFKGKYYSPAKVYQTIALERIFGGLKTKLNDEMKKDTCTQGGLYKVICDHMAVKIMENKEEYLQLVRCLYLDEKHNYQKFDRSKDEENFKEYCLEKANDRILQAFQDAYQYPVLRELMSSWGIISKKVNDLSIHTMAETPLQKLPQFQVVREQICKLTGIQPLLSEKRSAAIQTLKDWKEAEDRKKQGAENAAGVPANAKKQKLEITPEKLKESVETLLKADACYADLISAGKLPSAGGSAVTAENLDKIQVSINDNEVHSFAKKLLKCCSAKKPLAVSKEELHVVDMMKELKKIGKKVSLLEEEPGPNLI